jgi:hypothetical protein
MNNTHPPPFACRNLLRIFQKPRLVSCRYRRLVTVVGVRLLHGKQPFGDEEQGDIKRRISLAGNSLRPFSAPWPAPRLKGSAGLGVSDIARKLAPAMIGKNQKTAFYESIGVVPGRKLLGLNRPGGRRGTPNQNHPREVRQAGANRRRTLREVLAALDTVERSPPAAAGMLWKTGGAAGGDACRSRRRL